MIRQQQIASAKRIADELTHVWFFNPKTGQLKDTPTERGLFHMAAMREMLEQLSLGATEQEARQKWTSILDRKRGWS